MTKKTDAVIPANKTPNPFAQDSGREFINQGAVAIEQSRAIAEAQGKLIIAKNSPRDQAQAYDNVMAACARPGLAEAAQYSFPRGGTTVSGPSIRLAEELARCWGNIEYGIRELSQRPGESEMEAFAWDLQTNVYSSQKFVVKHERHSSSGVTKLTDPRDIYENNANAGARRLRARILAILPPDIVEAAVEACKETLTNANKSDLPKRIDAMRKAFEKLGIPAKAIEKKYGKKVADLDAVQLTELQGIYRSLNEGIRKASDFFEVPDEAGDAASKLNEKAATEKKKDAAPKAEKPAAPAAEKPAAETPQTEKPTEKPEFEPEPPADQEEAPAPEQETGPADPEPGATGDEPKGDELF